MKFLKHILIAALMFSLTMQSFASQTPRAMDVVRKNYKDRMDAYNELPTDTRIPGYTGTLNKLFARAPNKEPVAREKLKGIEEEVLKAVMGTALIHGDNMSVEIPTRITLEPAVQAHFEILGYAQSLSQKYNKIFGVRADNRDGAPDRELALSNKIKDLESDTYELEKRSGITRIEFAKWFSDVCTSHDKGLHTQNGDYWRDQKSSKGLDSKQDESRKRGEPSSSVVDADLEKGLAESMADFPPYILFVRTDGHPNILFERYHVPGDGTCGFYAIGKTRKEVADAVGEYFSSNQPCHEDEPFTWMLKGDLGETKTTNKSTIKLLSDEEIENLFLDRQNRLFNADLARRSIQKIKTRLCGDEYVSSSILALCAKLFRFNLHIFLKNEHGHAELRQSFTQRDFGQPKTTNTIYILNNSSAGSNAHYDLLVNPDEPNAASEKKRGERLERANLGQISDRSEAHARSYLKFPPTPRLQEDDDRELRLAIEESLKAPSVTYSKEYTSDDANLQQALEASLHDSSLKQKHKAPTIDIHKLKDMPLASFAEVQPEILKAYLDKGSTQIEYYDEIYKTASFDRNAPVPGLKRMVHLAVYSALRRHEIYPQAPELDANSKENLLAILADPWVQDDNICPDFFKVIVYEIGFILQGGSDIKEEEREPFGILMVPGKEWKEYRNSGGFRGQYKKYKNKQNISTRRETAIFHLLRDNSDKYHHNYILFGNKAAAIAYTTLAEGLLSTPCKIYYGLPMYVSKFYKEAGFTPVAFFEHDVNHKREMFLGGTEGKRNMLAKLQQTIKQYENPEARAYLLNFMSFLVFWDLHENGDVGMNGSGILELMQQYGKEFKNRLANEDAIEALQWAVKKSPTLFSADEIARFTQLDPRNNDEEVLLYELRFELFDIAFDKFLAGITDAVVAEKEAHL